MYSVLELEIVVRPIEFKENTQIKPCPKCKNNTHFVAESMQVCEDSCEVWVECICGYDPTSDNGSRLESVMGGTGEENVRLAMEVWNSAIG